MADTQTEYVRVRYPLSPRERLELARGAWREGRRAGVSRRALAAQLARLLVGRRWVWVAASWLASARPWRVEQTVLGPLAVPDPQCLADLLPEEAR